MKDSGVEWIGEIPEEWTTIKMKNCFSNRDGGSWGDEATGESGDCICLRIADFDYNRFTFKNTDELTVRHYPQQIIDKLLLHKNDILVEKSGGGEKTPVGRTVVFDKDYPALYANFMDRLRCQEIILPWYMQYVFVTFYKNDYTRNYIKQTTGIQNLDLTSMLAKEFVPLPTLSEQSEIIEYLNTKCAEIDAVIEKTNTSIEEYKHLKQAVITQAVTKGVRGDRLMKDSGIPWIGEIPVEWAVYRVANLYDERNESGCDELPVLMVSIHSGVSDDEVKDEDRTRKALQSEDKSKYKRVYPGDLVYNMMRAWQGAFGAVRVDGLVSPAYVVARPKKKIDTRYIEALFRTPSAIEEMRRYSYGIADFRMRLYWQYFKNIRFCLPDLEEQEEIANYLDEKCAEIDAVIAQKEQLLIEMENYKKSLIYEYVTGKKEVPHEH